MQIENRGWSTPVARLSVRQYWDCTNRRADSHPMSKQIIEFNGSSVLLEI